jgi:hypothetical protein
MFIIYSQSWITKENDSKIQNDNLEEKSLTSEIV